MKCAVDLCSAEARVRGWCSTHYNRWLKYGDPGVLKNVRVEHYPPGQKWCSACQAFRDSDDFSEKATSTCRECNNKMVRTYMRRNPVRAMLLRAKARATKLGLDFDLTIPDIHIPDTCPVLGIPLWRNDERGPTDNSPTLDRIDNTRGYVRGNVLVISFRANAIKRDAEEWEVRAVADYMKNSLIVRSKVA